MIFPLVSIFRGMPDVGRLAIRRVVHHVHNVPDVISLSAADVDGIAVTLSLVSDKWKVCKSLRKW